MGVTFAVGRPNSASLLALNYDPRVETLRDRTTAFRGARLRDLLREVGRSFGAVFTRRDCDASEGVMLLSQTDSFAMEPSGRIVRLDSMPHPERHRVCRWDVLISAAGQMDEGTLFGRCIIADQRLEGKYLGPDTIALRFVEPGSDLNLWVYAFLTSRTGLNAVKSCGYGTSIPRIRLDLLGALPVPLPDNEYLERVGRLIRIAAIKREEYAAHLRAARTLVMGLRESRLALEKCGRRGARCVVWRDELRTLGAWNYASAGEALSVLRRTWRHRVSDVIEEGGIFNGPRFARVPCQAPHGIDFFSQRDVFLVRPMPRRIVRPSISDRQLFVPEGSLLVGGHGSLGEGEIFGRVVYVSPAMARAGLTQDLLRIQPKATYAPVAYAFLSSELGFRLLRSTAVGTKLLTMRPDLLMALPFPELDASGTAAVSSNVSQAMKALQQADAAEADATRIVEEEVLPQWLA